MRWIDLRTKERVAVEIRDNIESYCQGQQYATFLNHLVPVFLKILDGNPVFISTSPEQVSAPSTMSTYCFILRHSGPYCS
jgi:hypothetical protein